jgi:hypothetical protein
MINLNGKTNKWINSPLVQNEKGEVYFNGKLYAIVYLNKVDILIKRRSKRITAEIECFKELIPNDYEVSFVKNINSKTIDIIVLGRSKKVIIPIDTYKKAIEMHGSIQNAIEKSITL